MLIIRCFLLLLTLTCGLTDNENQNDLSVLTNRYNKRIKRFLHGKSSKSRLKSDHPDTLPTDSKLLSSNNRENLSKSETKKKYTQQDLAEVQRILLKKEDDYFGILDISKHATPQKIVQAHRRLTLRLHPDKLNVPGATQATQRLNKARDELLKRFGNLNQNNENRQTPEPFTIRTSTLNKNDDQEVPDIDDKSYSISTSSLSSKKKKKTYSSNIKSYYIGITLISFLIGIVIFIIYWKKRQQHFHLSHGSKKQKMFPIYDSPESNDGDAGIMNENSEASIVQDEE